MADANQRMPDRLRGDACVDVVHLLFNLYEMKSPALMEHSRELARACEKLAHDLGWNKEDSRTAFLAGLLHDVGYLLSPTDIHHWRADRPAPAADMETDHPELGELLLHKVSSLAPILPAVRHHHENYNGTGFPDGLKGNQIPAIARLVTVVHEYHTLIRGFDTTKPMSPQGARRVVLEDAGILLDPEMVKVFVKGLPPIDQNAKAMPEDGPVPEEG